MDNIIRAAKKKRQKRNYFTQETEDAIPILELLLKDG